MHFKKLGKSDLKVSSYCLGTMTFGETTSEDDGHSQIDQSLEYGINFFDTAEMYPTCPLRAETTGNTEIIIGNWIKKNKSKRPDIILASKISGKATNALELNQYTFEVDHRAAKPQIKAAIEALFSVKVIGINTMNPPRRTRRVGKFSGKRSQVKKAIVRLAEGDKIQLFPES